MGFDGGEYDYDDMYPEREYDGDEGDFDDEEYDDEDEGECYDDEEGYLVDGVGFADPGGKSALRAATRNNPRDCTCPQCGAENVLTRIDRQRGYVCDTCADRNERGY